MFGTRRGRFALALLVTVIGFLIGTAPSNAGEIPAGDIAFIVDESGSMSSEIADVRARIGDIAAALNGRIDARWALVGFGGAPEGLPPSVPHTLVDFTDLPTFMAALDHYQADIPNGAGGREYGVWATTHAMSQLAGARAGAAVCAVLITDEGPDYRENFDADMAEARAWLTNRDATWYGIVPLGDAEAASAYGPDAGSLASHTNGEIFSIQTFRADAGPVLDELFEKCGHRIEQAASAAVFSATPMSGNAPLTVVFESSSSAFSYSWDFGDGAHANGQRVTHVFELPGTHTVTLTITDASGQTASSSTTIQVDPPVVSTPIEDVLPPDRLLIGSVSFSPMLVTSRAPIRAEVLVTTTEGVPVRGALVFLRGVPAGRIAGPLPEVRTDGNGIARFTLEPTARLPLRLGARLTMFVRARKQGERLIGGVSTRRLVSLRLGPPGAALASASAPASRPARTLATVPASEASRLIVERVTLAPPLARSRRPIEAEVLITDPQGEPVEGALVFLRGVPAGRIAGPLPEGRTNANGIARFTLEPTELLPLRRGARLTLFVRARTEGQRLIGGNSGRRLVSLRLGPPG